MIKVTRSSQTISLTIILGLIKIGLLIKNCILFQLKKDSCSIQSRRIAERKTYFLASWTIFGECNKYNNNICGNRSRYLVRALVCCSTFDTRFKVLLACNTSIQQQVRSSSRKRTQGPKMRGKSPIRGCVSQICIPKGIKSIFRRHDAAKKRSMLENHLTQEKGLLSLDFVQ